MFMKFRIQIETYVVSGDTNEINWIKIQLDENLKKKCEIC